MAITNLWRLVEGWLDVQMFRPSQAQLADRLGVSRSAVSQWKHGQARPTPENLRDLSRLTGIPFGDLRTAVVEDLGYTMEGQTDDETSMNRAPVSGAVTTRVDSDGVTATLPEREVSGEEPRSGRVRPGQSA